MPPKHDCRKRKPCWIPPNPPGFQRARIARLARLGPSVLFLRAQPSFAGLLQRWGRLRCCETCSTRAEKEKKLLHSSGPDQDKLFLYFSSPPSFFSRSSFPSVQPDHTSHLHARLVCYQHVSSIVRLFKGPRRSFAIMYSGSNHPQPLGKYTTDSLEPDTTTTTKSAIPRSTSGNDLTALQLETSKPQGPADSAHIYDLGAGLGDHELLNFDLCDDKEAPVLANTNTSMSSSMSTSISQDSTLISSSQPQGLTVEPSGSLPLAHHQQNTYTQDSAPWNPSLARKVATSHISLPKRNARGQPVINELETEMPQEQHDHSNVSAKRHKSAQYARSTQSKTSQSDSSRAIPVTTNRRQVRHQTPPPPLPTCCNTHSQAHRASLGDLPLAHLSTPNFAASVDRPQSSHPNPVDQHWRETSQTPDAISATLGIADLATHNPELLEAAGQMLMVGFDGHEVTDQVRELIAKYRVGSLILTSKNMKGENFCTNIWIDSANTFRRQNNS